MPPTSQVNASPDTSGDPSGAATLHLKRGEYIASDATLDHGIVTYTGQFRVRDLTGERLYETHTRSVRLAPGEWIEWLR